MRYGFPSLTGETGETGDEHAAQIRSDLDEH